MKFIKRKTSELKNNSYLLIMDNIFYIDYYNPDFIVVFENKENE